MGIELERASLVSERDVIKVPSAYLMTVVLYSPGLVKPI